MLLATFLATALLIAAPANSPLGPPSAAAHSCPTPKSYVLYSVPATVSRNVALTFDDGVSPKWTPQVLDILRANGVRATFFITGANARAYPSIVRRMVAEGHTVGNHSYNHPQMSYLSSSSQASQMDSTNYYISLATGGYKPCFFRPPYGAFNSTTVTLARNRGMSTTMWSKDTRDWQTPLYLSSTFQSTIVYRATQPLAYHPNVLMHDGAPGNYRQNTVNSVQRIITFYKSRGYAFTNPAGS